MHADPFVFSVFLIFSGAALLATFALSTRQPLIVAYIALGVVLGPHALDLVKNPGILASIGRIGIMFLLFLLGLDLHPRNFLALLSRTALVTVVSAVALGIPGYFLIRAWGIPPLESLLVAVAIGFSSTIIGLKLLPTTVLHHKHVGEMLVAILLVQDMLAIVVLILMSGDFATTDAGADGLVGLLPVLRLVAGLPLLTVAAFIIVNTVLLKLIARFDRFQEYIFLVAIGWCLALAVLAEQMGLSAEIGAFIAGISLANSPIAQWIATHLKPLRDFFLILFFFTVGAGINLPLMETIWIPALLLAALVLIVKPLIYRALLSASGESPGTAWEVGWRLGQSSEFSLLISYLGMKTGMISDTTGALLQAATIVTFVVSTYIVVLKFPSPIAIADRLRRD